MLWSKFPIQVYVERPVDANKSEEWVGAVLDVVREWGVYLPLEVVDSSEVADIRILRRAPPLRHRGVAMRALERLPMNCTPVGMGIKLFYLIGFRFI